MVQGGMKCVKFLLFAFNLIFFLAGLGLIIVGALVQTKFQQYFVLLGSSFNAVAILFIVVGSIVFIIGFFGCCGAYKENYCMVMTFAVLLGVVFVLEICAGVTAYVMRTQVTTFFEEKMTQGLLEYSDNLAVQKAWNNTQQRFECCGVKGPRDWCNETFPNVPNSCCDPNTVGELAICGQDQCDKAQMSPYIYKASCLQKLSDQVESNIYIIGGVGIGLAFVQIVGIIIACCLAQTIRKEYQVV